MAAPGDTRKFYEMAYASPIELTGIGSTPSLLFPGQTSKYWTDIKVTIETLGTQSAIFLGDQYNQFDLIGNQAYDWVSYSLYPGMVMNVSRFYVMGTNANNDGKIWITGLDPQITPDQVTNPFIRV